MIKKLLLLILLALFIFAVPASAAPDQDCPSCVVQAQFENTWQENLEERQQNAQEVKEQVQNRVEEQKELAEEKKEEFKNRLQAIRDQKKAMIMQRVWERMGQINTRWATHFENVLNRLLTILAKIESRKDKMAEEGIEVSEVETAIGEAEAAITVAQEAVLAQQEKEYTFDIDEDALRLSAQTGISEIREDLFALRDLVFEARDAVQAAFLALKDAWVASQ